ncbi:MAG: nucleotide-binding domain containing protein [Hyphomicrobiaceae bacterium]
MVTSGITPPDRRRRRASGAVVNGLGVTALEIGPEIDPGVPWTKAVGHDRLVLALKSSNFGAPDFFVKAWEEADMNKGGLGGASLSCRCGRQPARTAAANRSDA